MKSVTFEELLETSFDMLRHASCDNASVLLHMLEAIDVIGRETKSPEAGAQLLACLGSDLSGKPGQPVIDDDKQLIQRSSEALVLKFLGREIDNNLEGSRNDRSASKT